MVLKYLKQVGKRYESPCQGTPVTLGKLMVAQPDTPYISYECKDLYDREISSMGGGVVRVMTMATIVPRLLFPRGLNTGLTNLELR